MRELTEPKRILVVDDEELARKRLTRLLGEFDPSFKVEQAVSGIAAVELIRSFHPDLILLDVEMPGLNGFEVLQQFERRLFQIVFQTAFDRRDQL